VASSALADEPSAPTTEAIVVPLRGAGVVSDMIGAFPARDGPDAVRLRCVDAFDRTA